MRRSLVGALALAVIMLASRAVALPLTLSVEPVLGQKAPAGEGWLACQVILENHTSRQISGTLTLQAKQPWGSDPETHRSATPFAVAGKGRVSLEMYARGFHGTPPLVKAVATTETGEPLAAVDLPALPPPGPLLFDIASPSRIEAALDRSALGIKSTPGRSWTQAEQLTVSSPGLVPATADPSLPERAAGYAGATLVVLPSEMLNRISARATRALSYWVLSGGALAISLTKERDAAHPWLEQLVGGRLQVTREPRLARGRSFTIAREPPNDAQPPTQEHLVPDQQLAAQLLGFSGGNLAASPWGASASYGLGEVHFLAFRTDRAEWVKDRWVRQSLLSLVRHAQNRQSAVIFPHGTSLLDHGQREAIRRELDPNEGARWTIAAAAILLLLYAVFAGPLNFYLAARRGKPLRALLHLPVWAALTSLAIIGLGMWERGVEGRALRLTLIEIGAGMTLGKTTRFRGLYSSSADQLQVSGQSEDSLLGVVNETRAGAPTLRLERQTPRLVDLQANPWETVVVQEDTFSELGKGISVTRLEGDNAQLTNGTPGDLVGVFFYVPGRRIAFFPRIGKGESRRASDAITTFTDRPSSMWPSPAMAQSADRAATGLSNAWLALTTGSSGRGHFWTLDVPLVMAELDVAPLATRDAGLTLQRERILVRSIGYGSTP